MIYAVIVAGGKGIRMGGSVPKQFVPIKGIPVLMRTISNFFSFNSSIKIILVLPSSQIDYWADLCKDYDFKIRHTIVEGGDTRFFSVKNGLEEVGNDADYVMIHDGVRPFVAHSVMADCLEKAKNKKAVVPAVPLSESIRKMAESGEESEAKERSKYRLVQTPQTFSYELLREAYSQPYQDVFTDDASVVEAYGAKVYMVEGNAENIKLTTPFDLRIAETILRYKE